MKNIAVILAGGSGSRFGDTTPKQLLVLSGKMVIEYSIETFDAHQMIDEIYVVINSDYKELVEKLCAERSYKKVTKIICGGKERYHSTLAAIEATGGGECNMIFHDAARPLVPEKIISSVIESLSSYKAISVALPVVDTIFFKKNSCVESTPDRKLLYSCQTPQAFDRSVIKRAYEIALKDADFVATDDCGVVGKYLSDVPIFVVDGDRKNIKITHKEDLVILESLINKI